jgi:apolipoprotein D and lipocalin family protein
MATPSCFELCKYLGKWYELVHAESWFESNCTYNTTAEYTMNKDGTVNVCNRTWEKGIEAVANGTAYPLGQKNIFHVSFGVPEQDKIGRFFGTIPEQYKMNNEATPNYIIEKIWCWNGEYKIALVVSEDHSNFWVLSRSPQISARLYGEVMCYVTEMVNCKNIRQTPHYKC